MTATLIVDTADLNVSALSTTLGAVNIGAIVAVQRSVLIHSLRSVKVVIIVYFMLFG